MEDRHSWGKKGAALGRSPPVRRSSGQGVSVLRQGLLMSEGIPLIKGRRFLGPQQKP